MTRSVESEPSSEQVCFNCIYWVIDLEALNGHLRRLAESATASADTSNDIPPAYGRCRIDNIGSLGATRCRARDELGRPLFEPVPLD